MVNFVYLVGDRDTGEAMVIDAAYDVAGILDLLAADDMRLTGALATHCHPDHVGGDMMGHSIQGGLEILPECVRVSIELPWALALIAEKAKGMIAQHTGDLLKLPPPPKQG